MAQATDAQRLAAATRLAEQALASGQIPQELFDRFQREVNPQPNATQVLIHLELSQPAGSPALPAAYTLNAEVSAALGALARRVNGTVVPGSVRVITA